MNRVRRETLKLKKYQIINNIIGKILNNFLPNLVNIVLGDIQLRRVFNVKNCKY